MDEETERARRAQRVRSQRLFDEIAEEYLDRSEVSGGRMFASQGLAVREKFFAFVGREGRLILKLPAEDATALVVDGLAEPVTIGKRTMREWVGVPLPDPAPGDWPALMAAAYQYVALAGSAAGERCTS